MYIFFNLNNYLLIKSKGRTSLRHLSNLGVISFYGVQNYGNLFLTLSSSFIPSPICFSILTCSSNILRLSVSSLIEGVSAVDAYDVPPPLPLQHRRSNLLDDFYFLDRNIGLLTGADKLWFSVLGIGGGVFSYIFGISILDSSTKGITDI